MIEQNIAAAYVRVSDARQDEYSPESQIKLIRAQAVKDGYYIPDEHVYYDDGISGRSTKGRDSFKKMISDATSKEHPFSKLYIWKISRFSRSMEDSIIYKSMLEKKGVKVVSVSEPISDDIYGKLMERFLEWDAQFYSERLSEEVKRGLAEKRRRAEPTVPPPYGYKSGEKQYMPDEESGAADIIREVFTRFSDGEGMRTIAVDLGARGVLTRHGKKPDSRWVEYVINNPTYIGKLRYSSGRAISARHYDDDSIVVVDAAHTPLITTELWERAQARYKAQVERYGRYCSKAPVVQHMLKGIVRCSSCGATLVTGVRCGKAGHTSLQCSNYARGACHVSHSIVLYKLEAAVKDGLHKAIDNCAFTIHPDVLSSRSTAECDSYKRMLAAEERRLVRAREAYLAEIDTLEQYKSNKSEIEAKINEIKARITSLESAEVNTCDIASKVTAALDIIEDPVVSAQAKNEALRVILTHIIFDKANNQIALYFRP